MTEFNNIDWSKMDGLIPAIVQDRAGVVRMLGYMNRKALDTTISTGFVTFYSRSKGRLWTKGETSGNRLRLIDIAVDCDGDALLVRADADGPTCHVGSVSCFGATSGPFFPGRLAAIIEHRSAADPQSSYSARMMGAGVKRIAQKVGEEGVETALAATAGDGDELVAEAADLVFHLLLLLKASGKDWADISAELERRHAERSATASS